MLRLTLAVVSALFASSAAGAGDDFEEGKLAMALKDFDKAIECFTAAIREKKDTEADKRLQVILRDWEKASSAVGQMHYAFRRTYGDRVFRSTKVTLGEAFVRKPSLLRIDEKDLTGKILHVWLFDGNQASIFDFVRKRELTAMLPLPNNNANPAQGFRESLSTRLIFAARDFPQWIHVGFPVSDLKSRFEVTLDKDDDHWTTIDLRPRNRSDELLFKRLQVTLHKTEFWVRRIWMVEVNENTITWDFEKPDLAAMPPITRESVRRDLPTGWKR